MDIIYRISIKTTIFANDYASKMMNNIYYILSVMCFMFSFCTDINAQKKTVAEGEYTIRISEHTAITLGEALHKCVREAQTKAIKDEFGTIIYSHSNLDMTDSGTSFDMSSDACARGEWLKNIDEPEISVSYDDGELIIKAKVRGLICETFQRKPDFILTTLSCDGHRNVTKTSKFNSRDTLLLNFKSPADGYVAIYIANRDTAYRLLPYTDNQSRFPVKARTDYKLLDKSFNPQIKGYTKLVTNWPLEEYTLYTMFSPNLFSKPADSNAHTDREPGYVLINDFQKWLNECYTKDPEFTFDKRDLEVYGKK